MKPNEFRDLRKALGLSQEHLAYHLGVSRNTIVRIEAANEVKMVYAAAMREIVATRQTQPAE